MTNQGSGDMGQEGVGGRVEIGQEKKASGFQHSEYFCKALALQIIRKMVDHEAADDNING